MTTEVSYHALKAAISAWFDEQPIYTFTPEDADTLIDNLAVVVRTKLASLNAQALSICREMGTEKKVQSIKALRDATSCGLKEAKDAVERAHVVILDEQLEAARTEILRLSERLNAAKEQVRNQISW